MSDLARIVVGPDDAPALVLLHGITSSALSQADAIGHWAARGYRVIAVDARGHGLSPRWTPAELERAGQVLVDDVDRRSSGQRLSSERHPLGRSRALLVP